MADAMRRNDRPRTRRIGLAALLATCLALFAAPLPAGPSKVKPLSLDGAIAADGARVELRWPKGDDKAVTTVLRRELGATGLASWREVRPRRLTPTRLIDDGVEPGVAYEYQVTREGRKATRQGYWTTGVRAPAAERPGVALLLVDETVAPAIDRRLARFRADLRAEGWTLRQRLVPRGDPKAEVETLAAARDLRAWLIARRNEAPERPHTVILIGHVPLVFSGNVAPDGHAARPHPTDLFYGDVDGVWRDDGAGRLVHQVVPSDHIEMQVGRIDFSNLSPEFGAEADLLNAYFDKNHIWRRGGLNAPARAYANTKHMRVERDGLANLVGPGAVARGGHHKLGQGTPWLFGADFGSWKPAPYLKGEFSAVFAINFGSHKQDFSRTDNAMKAMLARPLNTVAVGWGARPSWRLHPMAMGRSIGYAHLRTVNNGEASAGGYPTREYAPTGGFEWINPIWVNLLGDPTLSAFVLKPVEALEVERRGDAAALTWSHPGGASALGFRVYRAPDCEGAFEALNPDRLLDETRFADPNAPVEACYMVRARGLLDVYAGSIHRFSAGAYARIGG